MVRKQCKGVAAKLRKRRVDTAPNTPGVQKAQWASTIIEETAHTPTAPTRSPPRPPPWTEENEDYLTQLEAFRTLQRQREKLVAKHFADKWQSLWDKYQRKHDRNPTVAQTAQLLKKERLEIHGSLARAESSLAVQIRIKKIRFAQFLHQQHVPAATLPACKCGWHSQTAKHIIWYCNLRPNR